MKKPKKILLIENNLDQPYGSAEIRRYLQTGNVYVRRAPDGDLPADLASYSHIVMSGSRASCLSREDWVERLLDSVRDAVEKNVPVLGICFGHQMIARAFGGIEAVQASATPEFGWVKILNSHAGPAEKTIMGGLPREFYSFASHFEEVAKLPSGFLITSSNDRCAIQSMRHDTRPIFGVQFHPERNVQEGQRSIDHKKKTVQKDFIFNDGKGEECFREDVTKQIFTRFLEIER